MTTPDINWTEHARTFCRANNEMNVAMIEKAMKEGASIIVDRETAVVKTAIDDLITTRNKANAPQ